jgi:hypothetical protein
VSDVTRPDERPASAAKAGTNGKTASATRKAARSNGRAKAASGGSSLGAPTKATKAKKTPAAPKEYVASGAPTVVLPPEIGEAAADIERSLALPVWLLIQHGPKGMLDESVLHTFLMGRDELAAEGPVALIVDSPGGYADVAYKIARTLCSHAGGFTAVIPRWAKSAATLLTLGSTSVVMGSDAELGPLDVQVYDEEREERGSALNEIQALEQLHKVGLEQLHETLVLLQLTTHKRSDVLLPHACKLVSDMMAPLLDKIDTVHYAKQSRRLRVAEEYAIRLMQTRCGVGEAKTSADRIVTRYPEHSFVIDREEAKSFVNVVDAPDEVLRAMRRIEMYLRGSGLVAVGRLRERT